MNMVEKQVKKARDVIVLGWGQAPTALTSSADCWALVIPVQAEGSEWYAKHGCELCSEDEYCEFHAYRHELSCELQTPAFIQVQFNDYSQMVDIGIDTAEEANEYLKAARFKPVVKYLPTFNALETQRGFSYGIDTIREIARRAGLPFCKDVNEAITGEFQTI
jgi:hypothetical protein